MDANWKANYYRALMKCRDRYLEMATKADEECVGVLRDLSFKDVVKFLGEFNEQVPLVKLSRWLGYVQGILIERGVTTVDIERDWTRPLFRPLDFG